MTRKQTIKDKIFEALDDHPEGLLVEDICRFHDYQINRDSLKSTLAVLARSGIIESIKSEPLYPNLLSDRIGTPVFRPNIYKLVKKES